MATDRARKFSVIAAAKALRLTLVACALCACNATSSTAEPNRAEAITFRDMYTTICPSFYTRGCVRGDARMELLETLAGDWLDTDRDPYRQRYFSPQWQGRTVKVWVDPALTAATEGSYRQQRQAHGFNIEFVDRVSMDANQINVFLEPQELNDAIPMAYMVTSFPRRAFIPWRWAIPRSTGLQAAPGHRAEIDENLVPLARGASIGQYGFATRSGNRLVNAVLFQQRDRIPRLSLTSREIVAMALLSLKEPCSVRCQTPSEEQSRSRE